MDIPPPDSALATDLLPWCALLRWFDEPLLQALTGYPENQVATLVTLVPCVETEAGAARYRLHPDQRAAAVARLRTEQPALELSIHHRAFAFFVQRLRHAPTHERHPHDEEACFHHLDELFFILNADRGWQRLGQLVGEAARVRPTQPYHQQLLHLLRGYIFFNTNRYQRAQKRLGWLLRLKKLDTWLRVRALNGLGLLHMYQSHYDLALDFFEQVVRLARATGNDTYAGVALINMGMIHNDLGRYDKAITLTEQSLHIFRGQDDKRRESYALYELGNNALYLGRWQQAEANFDACLTLCQGQTARLGYIRWGQGILAHVQGREADSEAAYQEALHIAESVERRDDKLASDTLWYLGFLRFTQGRWDEALATYRRAIALAKHLKRRHWLSLILYQCGNVYWAQGRPDKALALYRRAISIFERLRTATRNEQMKLGLLGTIQPLYEAMVALCLEQGQHAEAFHYMERARSRAFLDLLAAQEPRRFEYHHAHHAYHEEQVVRLAEVQAELPPGVVLLEYFVLGGIPRTESMLYRLWEEQRPICRHLRLPAQIVLFLVTRDAFEVVPIVGLEPNRHLQPDLLAQNPMRPFLHPRVLESLYQALVQPVESHLRGQELLYIVPHGPLHNIPFTALRAPDGRYLLDDEQPAIALIPSATVLLRTCRPHPEATSGSFLALGYNGQGAEQLRYAEPEARMLARVMGGEEWVGPLAKSHALLSRSTPTRWLHISSHGYYHPHNPLDSLLHIGAADDLNGWQVKEQLQFRGELVTLSACMSGMTHVLPGDELLGLPRAFLHAGAPAVLCTPWPAGDLVALLIMERFYLAVRAGQPAAPALRDAQVAVRAMTGSALLEAFARWQRDYPDVVGDMDFPTIPDERLPHPVFERATEWALFLLVGRAH